MYVLTVTSITNSMKCTLRSPSIEMVLQASHGLDGEQLTVRLDSILKSNMTYWSLLTACELINKYSE